MKHKLILLTMLLFLGPGYSTAQNGPVVSFTYDDGFAGWYDTAFPLFQEYGFPGVLCINAANSWVSGAGNNAVNKMLEMQAAGWEINNHTYDHLLPITEWEVSTNKDWLDAHGFPNSGFAAPFNDWNHNLVNIVKKYCTYYCASGGLGIYPPYDKYYLRRVGISNNISIETIKGYLDEAMANNLWIIFSGHDIGGTYGDPNDGWFQSPELIQMVFDEVIKRGIPVKTVKEVVNDLFPSDRTIECSDSSQQYPKLTYFEEDSLGFGAFDTSVWNEYWHNTFWTGPRYCGSPVVYCHSSNDSLPVMKFYYDVPNGEYDVMATIIEYDAGRTYRLYYSFDSLNVSQYNVEVSQNSDVTLGTVTITNGKFALYTQKADAISGGDGYVGWAFISLIPPPLSLNLKVILEGPYNGGGLMTTSLNSNNFIPLTSNKAYPTTVYGHYTVSNVASIPNSDIVDWVLVELRTGTAANTKVAECVVFLKSDGTIVDTDGSSPVTFTGLSAGNYYVVIRHRNHLAVMTATAIPLNSNSALYDFTTNSTQAYGSDATKDLGSGVYGMYSADGNNDGGIYGEDYILYQTTQGEEDYRIEDYNMDGGVYGEDYILFQLNQGYETWVP